MSSYTVNLRRMEERPMMKALVRHRFGGPGVVRVEEEDLPAVTVERWLVRVRASSLNKADWHELRGWPRFLRPVTRNGVLRPKTLLFGTGFAGAVGGVAEGGRNAA